MAELQLRDGGAGWSERPAAPAANGDVQPVGGFEDPVFVVGYMRSGTTMLRLMLNAHPRLALPPETELLQHVPRLLGRGAWRPEQLEDLVSRLLEVRADLFGLHVRAGELGEVLRPILPARLPAIIAALYLWWAHRAEGKMDVRWGDKKPSHWPFMSKLGEWYPGAQFIHLKRDPRDAIASMKQYFEMYIKGRSVLPSHVISAWYWRLTNISIERRGAVLGPARYMSLRYEDMVSDPTRQGRAICGFLNLEFSQAMMAFHAGRERLGGAGDVVDPFEQTRRAPHPGRIGRARSSLSGSQLADIEFLCGDLMARYGYQRYSSVVSASRGAWLSSVCAVLPAPWAALRGWRRLRGGL